ncbi:hypothetical protein LSAT2_032684 [Lamellibrachia satsuma]|nr:hypothetical protein LSAT2_032684 [Lamellibrachia satsuma]
MPDSCLKNCHRSHVTDYAVKPLFAATIELARGEALLPQSIPSVPGTMTLHQNDPRMWYLRGVLMTCTMALTYLCACSITTGDAWWSKKEPQIDYKWADCADERYWTFDAICCQRIVHNRIYIDDECCGDQRYNLRYELCCDGRPMSKDAAPKCPDNSYHGGSDSVER